MPQVSRLRKPAWPGTQPSLAAALMLVLMLAGGNAAAQSKAHAVLGGIVKVEARVPADARTADTLGTERRAHGALIDSDGHVLTIGYAVMEASEIRLTGADGKEVPAVLVAYDHNTGFGLVKALTPLPGKPLRFGDSDALESPGIALVAGYGGPETILPVQVVSRRPFAGYWEYLIDRAIYTSPPYPEFAGAGLFDDQGQLIGIGSLGVENAVTDRQYSPGNMFLPINALKPILAEMLQGRRTGPSRPWIGIYTEELRDRLFVQRVATDSPAAAAGLAANDLIVAIGGTYVWDQADFYRKLWALGDPGVQVPLTVLTRNAGLKEVVVDSIDRYAWLKLAEAN